MVRIAPLLLVLGCHRDGGETPAEITDRAWKAHGSVVAAGEAAKTCAEAGAAMQREFVARRQDFVDAMALDRDKAKLQAATDFIEKNEGRYHDLETRMTALSERCADEPTVQAAFAQMSDP
ncbi:MAG: hypothetical protein ACKV2T_16695 [Kofleriaceae bacterium]